MLLDFCTYLCTIVIMANVLPISEARSKLPEIVDLADSLSQRTFITVKGRIKAAVVSARELELLEETIEVLSDPKAMGAIKKGKKDVKEGRVVDWEDIKAELGL